MLELEGNTLPIQADLSRPRALLGEEMHGRDVLVTAASSLEALLQQIVRVDQDVKLVWHLLRPGEQIRSHFHPSATEWIIFQDGSFDLLYGSAVQHFEGAGQEWRALQLAPGVRHSLFSRSTFRYFVLRDRDDEIFYVDQPLAFTSLQSLGKLNPTCRVVVGDERCNAACPFCSTKIDPLLSERQGTAEINWEDFSFGLSVAKERQVQNALLTGIGEPTLFPEQIAEYLPRLNAAGLQEIELQTNGILLSQAKYSKHLGAWRDLGLSTIAISIAHYASHRNREIYLPECARYPDLAASINKLSDAGFRVRLSCLLLSGYIDTPVEVERLIAFGRENQVDEITLRPIETPPNARDGSRKSWAIMHSLTSLELKAVKTYLEQSGTLIAELPHGARVYDVAGQNVCLSGEAPMVPHRLTFYPEGWVVSDCR